MLSLSDRVTDLITFDEFVILCAFVVDVSEMFVHDVEIPICRQTLCYQFSEMSN